MQETAFVDSQGGLLSSRGGAQTHWHRHIGTSLTELTSDGLISSMKLSFDTPYTSLFLSLSFYLFSPHTFDAAIYPPE